MADSNSSILPKRVIDLTGQTFGKWTVLAFSGVNKQGAATWLCECECGSTKVQSSHVLRGGESKSCARCGRYRHGMLYSPEYSVWANMLTRCSNPNSSFFHLYGGRGIQVCKRWRESFKDFYEDMGTRPPRHTIDRIDNDGHYSCGHCQECLANEWPANCRWNSLTKQARNKRNNRMLTFNGETKCLAEWAEQADMSYSVLKMRLKNGWTIERALTTPVRHFKSYVMQQP